MHRRLTITGALALALGTSVASAQDLPAYEVAGFPITPVQFFLLGCSAELQEQSAAATLTVQGMPASPHQLAVLSPRTRTEAHATGRLPEIAAQSVDRAAVVERE